MHLEACDAVRESTRPAAFRVKVIVPAFCDSLLNGQEKSEEPTEAVACEVDLRRIASVTGGVLVDVSKHKTRVVDLGVDAP